MVRHDRALIGVPGEFLREAAGPANVVQYLDALRSSLQLLL